MTNITTNILPNCGTIADISLTNTSLTGTSSTGGFIYSANVGFTTSYNFKVRDMDFSIESEIVYVTFNGEKINLKEFLVKYFEHQELIKNNPSVKEAFDQFLMLVKLTRSNSDGTL